MKLTNNLINRLIFILALLGGLISSYLLYTYVVEVPIVCVDTGCEIVRESPYSYFLDVPLPAFGLMMYVAILLLSFLRTTLEKNDHHHLATKLISVSALVGVLISVYLTYLEAIVIKAYCMWCVASAFIIVLIFVLSVIELRRLK